MEFIIGLIVILLALFSVGYFLRKNIYKEIDRLEAWKIEILNRSIVEEISKIKHLKMTGETEQFFERWRAEWDDIVTAHLPKVEELLYDAEEYSDKYRFSKAKQVLAHIGDLLTAADSNIEDILKEIADLVTSEEQNRKDIEKVKEQYQTVRKNLLAYSHLYGTLYDKMEQDLDEAWEGIKQYEEETENGNYMTARKILLEQDRRLDQLQLYINDVPKLIADCKQTVPGQLTKLKDGYKEMTDKGYKLEHIQITKELENLNKQLTRAEKLLIDELNLDEASSILQMIDDAIQTLYDQLEAEVEAGQEIKSKMPELTEAFEKLEQDHTQTKAETALVKESYKLTAGELDQQKAFEKRLEEIEKLMKQIREKLDRDHVAYTLLMDEINQLENFIEEAKTLHEAFKDHLQSLRKEELQARETLAELKTMLTDTVRQLHKSNIPGVPADIKDRAEKAQEMIQQVQEQLENLPLNMLAVNQQLKEASETVRHVVDETHDMLRKVDQIERIIQYGNRFRSQNHILSEQLKEAERRFYAYDYNDSFDVAAAAVEKASPGAVQKLLTQQEKEYQHQ
ncbi:septation ring formation regulator EzrA [Bacillus altitudinis]|uniref:septation ring formation regulator EzrA n=1 Tax=Bacillus altitudinis TaxID=293387 RepID=UPI0012DD4D7A|nr:septation ring formation regulator EzrA [Bacillus altitudinis]